MALLIDKLKVEAAAASMHQFLPHVRTMVPAMAPDVVIEAVTVFLYDWFARELYGRRFAARLRSELRNRYKFGTPIEVDSRVWKITRQLEEFEEQVPSGAANDHDAYTAHVGALLRSILVESGSDPSNAALVREMFPRFEEAARSVKRHLEGIREQSHFVMKR